MPQIPGASVYGQSVALAKRAYQQALARINQQRSSTLRNYGYQADVDADTGTYKNLRVDPGNQYGLYQKMLRDHALRGEQAKDIAISRGLSMSGGLGAQYETQLRRDFGDESSQLGQTLSQLLFQLQDQHSQAKWDYDSALWQAQLEAARGAVESGDFSDSGYDWGSASDYGLPTDAAGPDPYGPPGPAKPGSVVQKVRPVQMVPQAVRKTPTKLVAAKPTRKNPYAYRPLSGKKPRGGSY